MLCATCHVLMNLQPWHRDSISQGHIVPGWHVCSHYPLFALLWLLKVVLQHINVILYISTFSNYNASRTDIHIPYSTDLNEYKLQSKTLLRIKLTGRRSIYTKYLI